MPRSSLPLLAALLLLTACRPAAESDQRPSAAAPASVTSELPAPIDQEAPREIVLGKLFAPDGSIQSADRATSFAPGSPILLSVESGDLPTGTPVVAIWTAPNGTVTEQKTAIIGGETYLTYTAPSTGWTIGTGRATVRIGKAPKGALSVEVPFEIERSR
ncbi:MAG TPA: hypothetical protein VGS22_19480 [Thermoanaerobaculia bacterium]|nr:hypothetical protein [Thermoanaerobaculia bacterium]